MAVHWLILDGSESVKRLYAFIYWRKWRSGQVLQILSILQLWKRAIQLLMMHQMITHLNAQQDNLCCYSFYSLFIRTQSNRAIQEWWLELPPHNMRMIKKMGQWFRNCHKGYLVLLTLQTVVFTTAPEGETWYKTLQRSCFCCGQLVVNKIFNQSRLTPSDNLHGGFVIQHRLILVLGVVKHKCWKPDRFFFPLDQHMLDNQPMISDHQIQHKLLCLWYKRALNC